MWRAARRTTGDAGVADAAFVRRAAFALAFLDYNVLGSGAINDDSQMLWVRSVVSDRLEKLAPFLISTATRIRWSSTAACSG